MSRLRLFALLLLAAIGFSRLSFGQDQDKVNLDSQGQHEADANLPPATPQTTQNPAAVPGPGSKYVAPDGTALQQPAAAANPGMGGMGNASGSADWAGNAGGSTDLSGNAGNAAARSAEQIAVQNAVSQAAQSYRNGDSGAALQQLRDAQQAYPNNLLLRKRIADMELAVKHVQPDQAGGNLENQAQSFGQAGPDQLESPDSFPPTGLADIMPLSRVKPEALAAPRSPAPQALVRSMNQAYQQVRMKEYSGAERAFNQIIEDYPFNPAAQWLARKWRGYARLKQGDYAGAYEDAAGALNVNRRDVFTLDVLAGALIRLGRTQNEMLKAVEQFLDIANNGKKLAKAYFVLSQAYRRAGQHEQELADLNQARKIDPADAEYSKLYGEAEAAYAQAAQARKPGGKPVNWPFWLTVLGTLLALAAAWAVFGYLESRRLAVRKPTRNVMRSMAGDIAADGPGFAGNGAAAAREAGVSWEPGLWLTEGFQVVRPLGNGGQGEVYLVFDKNLSRNAALKRMRPDPFAGEGGRGRRLKQLLKEGRNAAQLDAHPNIVHIYHVLELPGEIGLVFEYVEGETLGQILERKRRLPFPEVLGYLRPACGALAYAHERGFYHRDIKPSNIMASKEGAVKVMDFGIARAVTNGSKALTNTVMGTPPYMAPEAASGLICKESDIYSLGVTLYELLSGEVPFAGSGDKKSMNFRRLSSLVPGLPMGIDEFIAHALQPDPDHRVKTADEFLAALENLALAPKICSAKGANKEAKIPTIRGITPSHGAA